MTTAEDPGGISTPGGGVPAGERPGPVITSTGTGPAGSATCRETNQPVSPVHGEPEQVRLPHAMEHAIECPGLQRVHHRDSRGVFAGDHRGVGSYRRRNEEEKEGGQEKGGRGPGGKGQDAATR